MTALECAASAIFFAKINIGVSLLNMITAGLLIHASIRVRRAAQRLRDAARGKSDV